MNASSGQNLSDALMANENVTCARVQPRSALDGVTDRARLRRTNVTCIWGVSDPRNWARDRDRRVAEGVAHAPDASVTAADGRPTATQTAKSAARSTVVKLLIANNIATSPG